MFALPIFPGERPDRCLWQVKGRERVAAVDSRRWHPYAEENVGHRNGGPPSIVGASELNFCVRDGNRWTLTAINTNSMWVALNHRYIKSPLAYDVKGL